MLCTVRVKFVQCWALLYSLGKMHAFAANEFAEQNLIWIDVNMSLLLVQSSMVSRYRVVICLTLHYSFAHVLLDR